jgi:hypothetical protein
MARDRRFFDLSTAELRERAADDRGGVLDELSHRSSRAARKLAMELQGNGDAPTPKRASKPRKRKAAKVTPQVKAMQGTAPLGLAGSCKPCGGRGGYASGLACRTCEGSGNAPEVAPRWRLFGKTAQG